ncbi:MAG: hypothetical protein HFJ18_00355 [Clostridia bacterium]|nr:hypothetical protein [Clostridia bacterium]
MKKVTKILTIVLLVAMIVMSASNVFAQASNILGTIENSANTTVDMGTLPQTIGKVIAYIRNAAIIIGVVIIIILGIKYMLGSVEEKAGYQKSFVPLVVGIIVVMAATSIASFLFSLF